MNKDPSINSPPVCEARKLWSREEQAQSKSMGQGMSKPWKLHPEIGRRRIAASSVGTCMSWHMWPYNPASAALEVVQ